MSVLVILIHQFKLNENVKGWLGNKVKIFIYFLF